MNSLSRTRTQEKLKSKPTLWGLGEMTPDLKLQSPQASSMQQSAPHTEICWALAVEFQHKEQVLGEPWGQQPLRAQRLMDPGYHGHWGTPRCQDSSQRILVFLQP